MRTLFVVGIQPAADIQAADGRIGSIEQDIKRKEDRLNQLISLRAQQETRLDQLVSRSTTGNNTTIRSAQSALTALGLTLRLHLAGAKIVESTPSSALKVSWHMRNISPRITHIDLVR